MLCSVPNFFQETQECIFPFPAWCIVSHFFFPLSLIQQVKNTIKTTITEAAMVKSIDFINSCSKSPTSFSFHDYNIMHKFDLSRVNVDIYRGRTLFFWPNVCFSHPIKKLRDIYVYAHYSPTPATSLKFSQLQVID